LSNGRLAPGRPFLTSVTQNPFTKNRWDQDFVNLDYRRTTPIPAPSKELLTTIEFSSLSVARFRELVRALGRGRIIAMSFTNSASPAYPI